MKGESLMAGPPIVNFVSINQFRLLYWDKGSGADMDGAFYRPIAGSHVFIFGDYCQGNYNDPTGSVIGVTVQNDDPANPILKKPTGYSLVWSDKGSGADMDGSVWLPIAPTGYVALGAVSQTGYNTPDIPELRCLRFDQVVAGSFGQLIWSDKGSGADMDLSCYEIPGTGLFHAQGDYNPAQGPVWRPRQLTGSM
jgi:hypothetical protein